MPLALKARGVQEGCVWGEVVVRCPRVAVFCSGGRAWEKWIYGFDRGVSGFRFVCDFCADRDFPFGGDFPLTAGPALAGMLFPGAGLDFRDSRNCEGAFFLRHAPHG